VGGTDGQRESHTITGPVEMVPKLAGCGKVYDRDGERMDDENL
jgi:hypothetical protein